MTTPSPYGQPANPDPYATGYNQPAYPDPYATGYNQPVYPAADQPYAQPVYVQPYVPVAYGPYVVPKSRTTAALLAFFLGQIGAHNFYRGQTGRGFGHIVLILGVIICAIMAVAMMANAASLPVYDTPSDAEIATLGGAFILAWLIIAANGIWAFVEFIMILVSKDGSLQ